MSNLIETVFNEVETICEDVNGKKFWYVNGIFAQSEVINRNRRIYPESVLDESMQDYMEQYVKTSRAVGELNHPDNSQLNLDRVSHLIVDMSKDGRNYMGKARVLSTPCGKIVEAMLEGGVKLGVSTRANGSVKKNGRGIDEVQRGLKMTAVDIVANPSAPDAMVDAIMESEIVWESCHEDYTLITSIQEELERARRHELQEKKLMAIKKFFEHIRG